MTKSLSTSDFGDRIGEDRRKHPRTEVDEAGYISSGGSSISCRVLNISAEGAAIDVPNPAFVPNSFQLMAAKDRVTRNCRVVWVAQNRIGVMFVTPAQAD